MKSWHAIATADGFVVRNTRNPEIPGGRYAFGPYGTKKKACQVGQYQAHGTPPKGCKELSLHEARKIAARSR